MMRFKILMTSYSWRHNF